jgi:hypothetical protein
VLQAEHGARHRVLRVAKHAPDLALFDNAPALKHADPIAEVRMTSISWVISTIVSPRRWLISFSRVSTDKVFSGSSAEVASHSRISG